MEVKATVQDTPVKLTQADTWLANTTAKAADIAARYPPCEVKSTEDYRDIKRSRAALRKEIAAIETDRKLMTSAIEDAISAFKAQAKQALEPLTEIDEAYKQAVDMWEKTIIEYRKRDLELFYEELAPALALPLDGAGAPLVPFRTLWAKFAPTEKWQNMSTGQEAAKQSLEKVVQLLADGEKRIDEKQDLTQDEREEFKSIFFATLDYHMALDKFDAAKKQRQATKALEEARAKINTHTRMTPQEIEELTGRPAPVIHPVQETPANAAWAFCGYCSEHQAEALIDAAKRLGISRIKTFPTGGRKFKLTEVKA